MTPRRILYTHNTADIYGASHCLLRLTGALDRARFEPLVMLPEEGPLCEMLAAQGVPVIVERRMAVVARDVVRPARLARFAALLPRSVLAVAGHIRRERVDLVHANTGVIVSSGAAARVSRRPHVWHIRDWFQEFGRVWPLYAAYICRSSARVLPSSEAMAAQFADRRRVTVLHDGMDLREFADVDRASARQAFRARHGLHGFVVGIVGRIKIARKGQEVVVTAMAHLARAGRAVTCVVVGAPAPGSEHHLPELQRLARELGVEDRIQWVGEVPDARPVYPALDVLILASVQPEPFSGVVMEAMAMGVPVVASRNGGSVDQVEDGATGLLSRPGDGEDLAEKLAYLMDRPELRRQMGEAAIRRLATHFSMDGMIRRIEGIYDEALGA